MKLLLTLLERALASSPSASTRRLVQGLFCGRASYQTTCSYCDEQSSASAVAQDWSELELNVSGFATLDASLADLLSEEELKGDNLYVCDAAICKGTKREAKRATVLRAAPAVLSLHLKRFVYDKRTWARKKVTAKFAFPRQLDLRHALHPAPGDAPSDGAQYDLAAILVHKGNAATSGHYSTPPPSDCIALQRITADVTCPCSCACAASGHGAVVAVRRRACAAAWRAPAGRRRCAQGRHARQAQGGWRQGPRQGGRGRRGCDRGGLACCTSRTPSRRAGGTACRCRACRQRRAGGAPGVVGRVPAALHAAPGARGGAARGARAAGRPGSRHRQGERGGIRRRARARGGCARGARARRLATDRSAPSAGRSGAATRGRRRPALDQRRLARQVELHRVRAPVSERFMHPMV